MANIVKTGAFPCCGPAAGTGVLTVFAWRQLQGIRGFASNPLIQYPYGPVGSPAFDLPLVPVEPRDTTNPMTWLSGRMYYSIGAVASGSLTLKYQLYQQTPLGDVLVQTTNVTLTANTTDSFTIKSGEFPGLPTVNFKADLGGGWVNQGLAYTQFSGTGYPFNADFGGQVLCLPYCNNSVIAVPISPTSETSATGSASGLVHGFQPSVGFNLDMIPPYPPGGSPAPSGQFWRWFAVDSSGSATVTLSDPVDYEAVAQSVLQLFTNQTVVSTVRSGGPQFWTFRDAPGPSWWQEQVTAGQPVPDSESLAWPDRNDLYGDFISLDPNTGLPVPLPVYAPQGTMQPKFGWDGSSDIEPATGLYAQPDGGLVNDGEDPDVSGFLAFCGYWLPFASPTNPGAFNGWFVNPSTISPAIGDKYFVLACAGAMYCQLKQNVGGGLISVWQQDGDLNTFGAFQQTVQGYSGPATYWDYLVWPDRSLTLETLTPTTVHVGGGFYPLEMPDVTGFAPDLFTTDGNGNYKCPVGRWRVLVAGAWTGPPTP